MEFYVPCIDCGNASLTTLCDVCFDHRKPCKNAQCTARLNPNLPFDLCKRCTCTVYNCLRMRHFTLKHSFSKCAVHLQCKTKDCANLVSKDTKAFCDTCIQAWDKTCVRCTNKHHVKLSECGQLCCASCFADLPQCLECGDSKIKINAQGKSFNFCVSCLCRTPECGNRRSSPTHSFCNSCDANMTRCNKVGKRGQCTRPKLEAKHQQCNVCCRAPKCTFAKIKTTQYCKECTNRYANNGAEICKAKACFNYTQSDSESLCAECLRDNTTQQTPLVVETQQTPLVVETQSDDDPMMSSLDMSLMTLMRSPSTAT